MLDLFTIFSKGGIVLWCFQGTSQIFTPSVNALIRSVILQERTGFNKFDHNGLTLHYKLDNEFELIFVVAYQKILQLSYVDKFLNDIHLEFRDKYKNVLTNTSTIQHCFYDYDSFNNNYKQVLKNAEKWALQQAKAPKQMRTYEESVKSKKTVASMIERKNDDQKNTNKKQNKKSVAFQNGDIDNESKGKLLNDESKDVNVNVLPESPTSEDVIKANRLKLAQKLNKTKAEKKKSPKSPTSPSEGKGGKKPRVWELSGKNSDLTYLERTTDKPPSDDDEYVSSVNTHLIGKMQGNIKNLEIDSSTDEDDDDDDENDNDNVKTTNNNNNKKSKGIFSLFKTLVNTNRTLSLEDMAPVLDKLKDHLISKNVASDIADKLCQSVGTRLEGKIIGTFDTITTHVKQTLNDALVQILSSSRRIDILRDCLEINEKYRRPYVIVFCGVNGVGKSTNLAKICFWLIENNQRVLIAACDTFRAGAVEQLRTHTKHLNALHSTGTKAKYVELYEKGYGKDAAAIAMEAIKYANDSKYNVVLIDTAGRMQDNEPLMRSLTKLIKINEPDLVLFVGEALVGNEAVDQLIKFNKALADYSLQTQSPHLIDGIVLTKFDTIDDKVGAAISMTYITGQPIIFVGTGQQYTDLKALNAKAVVHALMK
ncbi:signal recognition particle receptor subunit alpha homolog [Chrysoperla carnea]|uniref:signal recognition particle receptor subunit alpha homolog n=1 Tax=Chrysoperla carnea TaxID=189513 RepID=UPI001D078177|nr:signal recognition particle receptor subunit alpha homolog [Chrysoperla carnea]